MREKSAQRNLLYTRFKTQYHQSRTSNRVWMRNKHEGRCLDVKRPTRKVARTSYKIDKSFLQNTNGNKSSKVLQIQNDDDATTWHARLVHISVGVLNNMVKKDMVIGMPQIQPEKNICNACLVGKQTRNSFPIKAMYRAAQALELIHRDLCGPISSQSLANN